MRTRLRVDYDATVAVISFFLILVADSSSVNIIYDKYGTSRGRLSSAKNMRLAGHPTLPGLPTTRAEGKPQFVD